VNTQLQNEVLGSLESLPEEADLKGVIRVVQVKIRIA
jgi:hypothetical protein